LVTSPPTLLSVSDNGLLALLLSPIKKRKTYFAFHFEDIMRVNVVRNSWKIERPDAPQMRSFYDSSLWERRQIDGVDAVKRLIREWVGYTSAICVLVGTETWLRPWVRYEIARAVIDNRGLVAVHINSIRHHVTKQDDPLGHNPLSYMGVGKVQPIPFAIPQYYLFELRDGSWVRYQGYTNPVSLPSYLADPAPGYVTWLSAGAKIYDFIGGEGHKNIGRWIDEAARQVGG